MARITPHYWESMSPLVMNNSPCGFFWSSRCCTWLVDRRFWPFQASEQGCLATHSIQLQPLSWRKVLQEAYYFSWIDSQETPWLGFIFVASCTGTSPTWHYGPQTRWITLRYLVKSLSHPFFWWILGESEWGEFPKVIPGESISPTTQMKFIGGWYQLKFNRTTVRRFNNKHG